jgi:hypothetical protein
MNKRKLQIQRGSVDNDTTGFELPVPLGRSPFRIEDPAISNAKTLSPEVHYGSLAGELSQEVTQLDCQIRDLEARLEQDKERARRIAKPKIPAPLRSLSRRKELLSPEELMELQNKLAALRTRRASALRNSSEYRLKAYRWHHLVSRPEEAKRDVFGRVDTGDYEAFAMVSYLAESDSDAAQVLGRIATRFILPLIRAAKVENMVAAEELVAIASLATQAVNRLGAENPGILKGIARKSFDWPVMASLKKNFHTDPASLLEALEQGYQAPMPILPESNWTKDDLTGRVAWKLWHYVNYQREMGRSVLADRSWGWQLDHLQRAAAELEEFSSDWSRWWEVAKIALKETYSQVNKEATLRRIGLPKRNRNSDGVPPESHIRRAIFRELQAKFKSFAGANRG